MTSHSEIINLNDITGKILYFYQQLENDINHRYKSWDHCFAYFKQENLKIHTACLQLAFYLASWGMYRGSSFLLWKDYLIHQEVVEYLISKKHLQKIDFTKDEIKQELEEVFDVINWIRSWYQNNIQSINGKNQKINVTDTLVTKILLGTLGCIPAYDRYFIDGIRSKGLSHSKLKLGNFASIVKFYNENQDQFWTAKKIIYEKSGIDYPPMKLVDMFFWQLGYEADQGLSKAQLS